MSNRYQIVVQGEASETDSDDEVYITSMSAPQPATSGAKVRQCVWECQRESSCIFRHLFTICLVCYLACCQVPGEASETDSEAEEEKSGRASALSQQSSDILRRDLPPLIVVRDHPDIQSVVEDRPSPTHRSHGEGQHHVMSSYHVPSLADGWVLATLLWTEGPQIRIESQIKSQCQTFLGLCWHQMEY